MEIGEEKRGNRGKQREIGGRKRGKGKKTACFELSLNLSKKW